MVNLTSQKKCYRIHVNYSESGNIILGYKPESCRFSKHQSGWVTDAVISQKANKNQKFRYKDPDNNCLQAIVSSLENMIG